MKYAHLPALVNDDGVMVGYVDVNHVERDLSGAVIPPGTTPTPGGDVTVDWADVQNKPDTFPATTPVATATALATGRTIALTGGATGTSAAFNGTANASITVTLRNATTALRGAVLQSAAQADSAAADVAALVTDFNALLAKLRTAGVIAT